MLQSSSIKNNTNYFSVCKIIFTWYKISRKHLQIHDVCKNYGRNGILYIFNLT